MTATSWQPWAYTLTWQFHGSMHGPHIVSLRATLCTLMALLEKHGKRKQRWSLYSSYFLAVGMIWRTALPTFPWPWWSSRISLPCCSMVRLAHVNSTIMPTTSVCIIQYTHTATVHCTAQTLQSTFTRRHLALHSVLGLFSETTSYFVSCFRILELEFSCWVEKKHHWKRCAVITQSETVHAGSPEKKRCSMGSSTN